MRSRPYWIISLVMMVTALFAACGPGKLESGAPGTTGSADEPGKGGELAEPAPAVNSVLGEDAPKGFSADHEPVTGDLDEIVGRRYIRALVVYGKTSFFYDGARPRGISYEAFSEFERFLNRKLKTGRLPVHMLYVPIPRERLLSALVSGLGDIAAANLTVTPERLERVDFTMPVLDHVSEVVVTGPSAVAVSSLDDLAGQKVYVRVSSSYYSHLRDLSARFESSGRAPIRIVAADERLEDEDILEMVNAGLAPITIIDSHKAGLWSKVFKNIKVDRDLKVSEGGEIAWAIRKDSPKLKAVLNEFLRSRRAGTSFGNTLIRRYLGSTKFVKNATSTKEMRKFNATVDLFKKYAARYDFDWLLIAAQAYQESGLEQNVKSRVGAVGIMQVMPKTAAAKPIGIKGINRVEPNIQAGVKILDYYRRRYFNDEKIDDVNRTLLAFAAYNAGPNRINRLRKKAAELGYDPNVWFDNVERVVARQVGREPVRYVANIYKYYIAYKLTLDAQNRKSGPKG